MKYFYMDIDIVKNDLTEEQLNLQLTSHLRYLDNYFDNNTLLLGGSKTTKNGGFVIAKFDNIEQAIIFYENDPMYKAGYLKTDVIPFNVYRENAGNWFES